MSVAAESAIKHQKFLTNFTINKKFFYTKPQAHPPHQFTPHTSNIPFFVCIKKR
jgi:hypothetical protein